MLSPCFRKANPKSWHAVSSLPHKVRPIERNFPVKERNRISLPWYKISVHTQLDSEAVILLGKPGSTNFEHQTVCTAIWQDELLVQLEIHFEIGHLILDA